MSVRSLRMYYRNYAKLLHSVARANSVDLIRLLLKEQSDQGLHCLQYCQDDIDLCKLAGQLK